MLRFAGKNFQRDVKREKAGVENLSGSPIFRCSAQISWLNQELAYDRISWIYNIVRLPSASFMMVRSGLWVRSLTFAIPHITGKNFINFKERAGETLYSFIIASNWVGSVDSDD